MSVPEAGETHSFMPAHSYINGTYIDITKLTLSVNEQTTILELMTNIQGFGLPIERQRLVLDGQDLTKLPSGTKLFTLVVLPYSLQVDIIKPDHQYRSKIYEKLTKSYFSINLHFEANNKSNLKTEFDTLSKTSKELLEERLKEFEDKIDRLPSEQKFYQKYNLNFVDSTSPFNLSKSQTELKLQQVYFAYLKSGAAAKDWAQFETQDFLNPSEKLKLKIDAFAKKVLQYQSM